MPVATFHDNYDLWDPKHQRNTHVRSKLEGIKAEPWQTDTSIGTWFCRRNATYALPKAIIGMFVDIVSKNDNLLLNIPLMADGTLDAGEEQFLAEMARWTRVNGEANFSTRPWRVFGEGPTSVKEEYSEEIKESFTSNDIRFTTRDDVLFAFFLDWPADRTVTIAELGTDTAPEEIAEVRLLGHSGRLTWNRHASALEVVLPDEKPCEHAFAFKVLLRNRRSPDGCVNYKPSGWRSEIHGQNPARPQG